MYRVLTANQPGLMAVHPVHLQTRRISRDLPAAIIGHPLLLFVEVRVSISSLWTRGGLIPVSRRLEVTRKAKVFLDNGLIQFDSKPWSVGHGDVAAGNNRLGNAGDQLLPPGHEVDGVVFHRESHWRWHNRRSAWSRGIVRRSRDPDG